jgi:hypothetical protein
MTIKDDLASRSGDIHWPEDFDPRRAFPVAPAKFETENKPLQ